MLSCDVSPELVPFVHWEQNRSLRELDDRISILSNGSLVISNANESDVGLYRCGVGSGAALKYSEEAEVKILAGKKFLHLSHKQVQIGTNSSPVTKTPPAHIQ